MIPSPFLLLPSLQLSARIHHGRARIWGTCWRVGRGIIHNVVTEKSDSTELGLFGFFFFLFSFALFSFFFPLHYFPAFSSLLPSLLSSLLFFLFSSLPFPFSFFFSLSFFFPLFFFSWLGMWDKERKGGLMSALRFPGIQAVWV